MEFKIPSDLADIGNIQKHSGIQESQNSGINLSNLKQKRRMKGFQTLPKLENISYSSTSSNSNNGLQSTPRRRHTKIGKHHKKSHSKSHQPRHKRRNNRRHNRRHNPMLLRDIANDQPVSQQSANEEFTPYAPIIEQVKLTNQELKEILKLHQKSIDQELQLLDQFSRSNIHHPKNND